MSGESFPLSARILAASDIYDAPRTERPYKKAIPNNENRAMIEGLRGTHLDPLIVDAFVRQDGEFCRISEEVAELLRPRMLRCSYKRNGAFSDDMPSSCASDGLDASPSP